MKKIISAIGAALLLTATLFGQTSEQDTTTIRRSVLIEKDYTLELEQQKRKNIEYSVQELTTFKSEIAYSNYVSNIQPQPLFYPLTPQKNRQLIRKKFPKGYFVAGFGYPVAWKAGLYYPIVSDYDTDFDILLDHDGFVKGKKQYISTDLDINFRKKIGSAGDFYGSVGYAHDYNTYYAENGIDAAEKYRLGDALVPGDSLLVDKYSFINRAGMQLGMRSTEDLDGWSYDVSTDYALTAAHRMSLYQHSANLDATVGKEFNGHKVQLSLLYAGQYYAQDKTLAANPHTGNTALALAPYYMLDWHNLSLRAGVKIWFSFNKGQVVNAMPDVKVNYNILKFMSVYAVVSGDYKLNSVSSMLEECPYFEPLENLAYNTYKPLDTELGFKIKPFAGMMLDIYGGYSFAYNDVVFSRRVFTSQSNALVYGNTFMAEYLDVHNVTAGARINYNFKDRYIIHGALEYNIYRTNGEWQKLFYRPELEWEVGAEIKPVENLVIDASFRMATGYTAKALADGGAFETVKMKNRYNLNLGASYGFKNNVSVFLDLNNILSLSKSLAYQDWLGYDNRGFHFIAGVRVGF